MMTTATAAATLCNSTKPRSSLRLSRRVATTCKKETPPLPSSLSRRDVINLGSLGSSSMMMLFTGGPAGAVELNKGDVAPEFKLPSTTGIRVVTNVRIYICIHVCLRPGLLVCRRQGHQSFRFQRQEYRPILLQQRLFKRMLLGGKAFPGINNDRLVDHRNTPQRERE